MFALSVFSGVRDPQDSLSFCVLDLVTRNARREGRVGYLFFTRYALRGIPRLKTGRFLFFLLGMPAGQAVYRFGSGIFFFFVVVTNLHINYAGCPKGHTVSKNGSISFCFFVVATNLYINLFIKLSPLLLGMYCSDCLQQKRDNQNLFFSLISQGRGPTYPYLCDVKASFDLFINLGLNL